jgi:hypothetical protein
MPILGIIASQGRIPSTSFESIATATMTGGVTSTITFSSIPQTYKHLQIRGIARETSGSGQSSFSVTANGSSTGYAWHYIYGSGSSVVAGGSTGDPFYREINFINSGGTLANTFNAVTIDILDYTSTTKSKVLKSLGGCDYSSAGGVHLQSGLWDNTSAITSLTFSTVANSFDTNTQFALYGIKG